MEIAYNNFSLSTIPDNEASYFAMLKGAIASVDHLYYMSVTRAPTAYLIRISLSTENMINSLISQINSLNNALHIHVEYSKSAKKGNLFFKVFLES